MLRIIFLLLLTITTNKLYSQNKEDNISHKNHYNDINFLFNKADYFNIHEKNKDSLFFYLNLLDQKLNDSNDGLSIARLNTLFADGYTSKSIFNKTIKHAQEALIYYEKNDLLKEASLAKSKIGIAYQGLYKGKEAIKYLKEAEAELSGDDLILVYLGLGNTYLQLNDLENALKYLTQALEQEEKRTSKDSTLINIYNSIAVAYNKNKDYKKTKIYLEKTIKLAEENKNYLGQVLALHNIGVLFLDKKKYAEASIYLKKAYDLIDNINHTYLKGMVTYNHAKALYLSGKKSKTKELINKAEKFFIDSGAKIRIPYIYNLRAIVANQEGDHFGAIKLLQEGIELSKENEIAGIVKQNYFDLSTVYNEAKMYRESLTTYKRYEAIKDSISFKEKLKEIETLKVQFEVNEMEQDLAFKNQKLIVLDAEKKANNYQKTLLVFLGLGLLFFIYRQRKINNINTKSLETEKELVEIKEEKLQSEIKFKNSEITEFAIHINDRNKLLKNFSKKLKVIKQKSSEKEVRDLIHDIQFYIDDNIVINKEKIELNTKIERTEESFRFSLKKVCPNLTDKEIKVATYLVLDIPSKQIANQMGIIHQSVNNYRFSIRKKMGLKKNDDLIHILKTIDNN